MPVSFTRLRAVVAVLAVLLGLAVAVAPQAFAATGVTDVWTGMGDGESWTDPLNWSTVQAPANGDSVIIAPPSKDHCSAHVVKVPADVQLQNFTMTEASPADGFDCLASVSGGSISVAGSFTVHSGVVDTPVTMLAGSTGTISPFTGFPDSSEFDQDLTVHGTLTLDGNVADADGNERPVSFSAAHTLLVASDGELDATDGNLVTGTSCCVTQNHVTNDGLLKIEGGTLAMRAIEFDQDATLDAENAAQLTTDASPETAGDGATYTGNGSWATIGSADTTFSGTQNLGPSFHLVLGGSGSQTSETFLGTYTLAGSGTFDWLGGDIESTATVAHGVTVNARGNITTDARELSGGPDGENPYGITNHGVLNLLGASYYATSNGYLANQSDGTLYLSAGTSVSGDCCQSGTPNEIVNAGGRVIVQNTASTAPVVLNNVSYRQTGGNTIIPANHSLQLTGGGESAFSSAPVTGGGTLVLAGDGSVTRALTIGTGTTLQVASGGDVEPATSAAASVNGAGAVAWTGGSLAGPLTVAATGGVRVSGAQHEIATFNGAASSVTINAPTTFVAGTKTVPDEVDFASNGALTLSGASSTGGFVTFHGGRLFNAGTLSVQAGASAPLTLSSASLTNRGSVTITGLVSSDGSYTQTAGSTNVAGTLAFTSSSSAAKVLGGVFGGRGTVQGNVVNSAGQLQPGMTALGTLTITGNYSQAAAASTQLQETSAGTDLVAVGGRSFLMGDLDVVNAGYTPPVGQQRTVFTNSARPTLSVCTATTGTGATTQHWVPSISGTSVVLTSATGAGGTC